MKVGLIGYGDLGRQIENLLIQDLGLKKNEIFYFDDNAKKEGLKNGYSFKDYMSFDQVDGINFLVCLGYKHMALKEQIISELKNAGKKLISLCHSSAFVNNLSEIGEGSIVYPKCNIDQNVVLNSGVLLNNSVTVSHDTVIGESTFIAPGVVICGNVTIGKNVFIGAGSIISNGVSIGDNVVIGIGSCVNKNVQEGKSIIGNPMREVKSISLL